MVRHTALHPSHRCKGPIGLDCFRFALRHDAPAVFAVWGEYAMKTGQVEPWARHQSCQAGDEVERIEHDMGRAIAERLLELVDDLPALVGREALVSDRRPGDVTTEFFELVTLVSLAAGGGMK